MEKLMRPHASALFITSIAVAVDLSPAWARECVYGIAVVELLVALACILGARRGAPHAMAFVGVLLTGFATARAIAIAGNVGTAECGCAPSFLSGLGLTESEAVAAFGGLAFAAAFRASDRLLVSSTWVRIAGLGGPIVLLAVLAVDAAAEGDDLGSVFQKELSWNGDRTGLAVRLRNDGASPARVLSAATSCECYDIEVPVEPRLLKEGEVGGSRVDLPP